MEPGHVAERAAADKRAIYTDLLPPFAFVPLVYETHGRPCEQTQQFFFATASVATRRVLGFDAIEGSPEFARIRNGFLGRWSREISVALQRANAKMIVFGRAAGLGLGSAGILEFDYSDDLQDIS